MERGSVEAIIAALNAANVRYLVVGGLAVVAHGHVRFTADLDLVLELQEDNVKAVSFCRSPFSSPASSSRPVGLSQRICAS